MPCPGCARTMDRAAGWGKGNLLVWAVQTRGVTTCSHPPGQGSVTLPPQEAPFRRVCHGALWGPQCGPPGVSCFSFSWSAALNRTHMSLSSPRETTGLGGVGGSPTETSVLVLVVLTAVVVKQGRSGSGSFVTIGRVPGIVPVLDVPASQRPVASVSGRRCR